jgi:dTDP-4-dehydrorhamnose reductase
VKILLLGRDGQLGWELERALAPLGAVAALGSRELDLADADALVRTVRELRPEAVVNAAAYNAVDRAESEPERAQAVNGHAPGILAEEAGKVGAVLIHYSSDYVFDGRKGSAYTEDDEPQPLSAYGRSKLAGEGAVLAASGGHLVLRTAWVYSTRRDSFVSKVLQWSRRQQTVRIVDDQVSNPTWARGLAEASALVLGRGREYAFERAGLYHLAGDGFASRYAWAQEILRLDPHAEEQVTKEVLPAATAEFPAAATRPSFSALDCARFQRVFGLQLPDWRHSLALAMQPGSG